MLLCLGLIGLNAFYVSRFFNLLLKPEGYFDMHSVRNENEMNNFRFTFDCKYFDYYEIGFSFDENGFMPIEYPEITFDLEVETIFSTKKYSEKDSEFKAWYSSDMKRYKRISFITFSCFGMADIRFKWLDFPRHYLGNDNFDIYISVKSYN